MKNASNTITQYFIIFSDHIWNFGLLLSLTTYFNPIILELFWSSLALGEDIFARSQTVYSGVLETRNLVR